MQAFFSSIKSCLPLSEPCKAQPPQYQKHAANRGYKYKCVNLSKGVKIQTA